MAPARRDAKKRDLPEEVQKRKRIILGELTERSLWFIRLRWLVPPSIGAGTAAALIIGVKFAWVPVLLVALFILGYNLVFWRLARGLREKPGEPGTAIQRFTYEQVALDYTAMFLLIHFTGGAASPLIFFFIFHIIFASILLPARSAYGFAGLAAVGMVGIAFAEYFHVLLPHHDLDYPTVGAHINLAYQPFHMLVELGFFTASVFITAYSTTAIMSMLRRRMVELVELSEALTALNNRLSSLYAVIQAILSTQHLAEVLKIVTRELAAVMDVKGISIKLLSEDRKFLQYAAVAGLPEEFMKNKLVEVAKSPLNRRIIEGEPFATGKVTSKEMFQFGEDLDQAKIQSVLFVPLLVEDRVIGILGAYCRKPERFDGEEVEFFRLVAGLVAIALENARAYESIENMIRERSWFMTRVAHNLRAPLAAIISILEVLRGGYQGELTETQQESVRRVDRRARTMLSLINELMTLAEKRSEKREFNPAPLDLPALAGRLERTFEEEAREKNLAFKVAAPEDLPRIVGDQDMIEQMLENLVSNAIKYTPAGGKIGVEFSRGADQTVRIIVSDNGIGIPKDALPRLFTEFFRADNAKALEEVGTGLGLTIIKEIVELHGGRILVESEEGLGTAFFVHLPVAPEKEGAK